MAEIRIPLQNHGALKDIGLRVEMVEGYIDLSFDAETPDGQSESRTLSPDEARALAAALRHCAHEATA